MGKAVKLIVILIILIALGVGAKVAADKLPTLDDSGGVSFITADALKRLYGSDPSKLPEGVRVLEPSDCQADDDAWVKKSECAVDGLALTGDINSCGAGKEIWIRDPEHSSFVAAVGTGTCEEEERDCTVECPVDCEGDTYIDPDPPCTAPTGVVLDGVNTCGVGLKTYELDTNAADYVAPIGKGECQTSFRNACEVGCPEGVRPETSCVDYANPQKSANGCVVSQMPNARLVTYDEPGFQEWFRLPVDPTAPGCDDEGHMDSWWVPCTGPPRPVNCEGTWGVDGGWGQCTSESVCEAQTQKTRTFTRTKEAAHGGTCNLPADGTVESSVLGCPLLGACCEVDTNIVSATSDKYKQPREGTTPTCAINANYRIVNEAYPDACADKNIATTTVLPCCYEEDDWSPVEMSAAAATIDGEGLCDLRGKFTQYQTVYGQCDPGTNEREADCEYVGPWQRTTSEECSSDGKRQYFRTTKNSSKSTTKSENCDYYGDWYKSGGCGSDGIQWWERKTVVDGIPKTEREERECCYVGEWKKDKVWAWPPTTGLDVKRWSASSNYVDSWEGWKYIDKDKDGNEVNTEQGNAYDSGDPHHFKYYWYKSRPTAGNCDPNKPEEKSEIRKYYCNRSECRYRPRYYANAYGYPSGKHCVNNYVECSEDDNDYIKGGAYNRDYTTNKS